ncbi:MAG: RNA 2'-phosphotransferase [Thermoplasmata archaeon]|nr:RNA 2'-phosphotransferase [Thermoplasmata archaeon]
MNDREMEKIGRMIAGMLRHFPEKYQLSMDEHGWVSVAEMVKAIKKRDRRMRWIRSHHIYALVETDPKGRYQVRGERIRATYGHSISVDLDLPTDGIPDELFYPTTEEEVDLLLESGIMPADRKMVHLSSTYETAYIAGSHRVENPIILKVDAKKAVEDGIVIMRACDTVFLVKEVPPEYVTKVEGKEPPSDAAEEE